MVVKHVENGWETLMFDDDSEEDDTCLMIGACKEMLETFFY